MYCSEVFGAVVQTLELKLEKTIKFFLNMSDNTFSTFSTNFSGSLETGVDPRTGQFFMNLPLANITSNNLTGPAISLSARYSTLSSSNSNGFGKGITNISLNNYS